MISFPVDRIHDEDAALDWWEHEFAESCEAIGAQVDAAALTRVFVASIREIRDAAFDANLSLIEAAAGLLHLQSLLAVELIDPATPAAVAVSWRRMGGE